MKIKWALICAFIIFVEIAFSQTQVNHGCCVSPDQFHRRCICQKVNTFSGCKSLCSDDVSCKGFVLNEGSNLECQLSTTAQCPSECDGPFDENNVKPLYKDGLCGNKGKWNGGCFIKSGYYLMYIW